MSKRFRALFLGRIVITITDRRSVCINGRGERSEPDEHARSRRARRRAVRGGWCDAHDGPHDRGVRCGRRRGVFHPARRSRPRRRRPRHRGRRPARGRTFPHPRTSSCAASGVDLRRAQLPGDGVCGGRLPLHGADRTGVRLHGVRPCIWSRGEHPDCSARSSVGGSRGRCPCGDSRWRSPPSRSPSCPKRLS